MSLVNSIDIAIQDGVISGAEFPVSIMDWEPPACSPDLIDAANLLPSTPEITITPPQQQWGDPARDNRAQLYEDKGIFYNLPLGATDGQVYELARFGADQGECGFVKYIGTYVQIVDGGGSPVDLDFSNPFAMQDNGVNAEFLLRLSPGDESAIGSTAWSGPFAETPGYGYPQLPHWNDYRFYWGRYANHVWFLVPRNHYLRLYIRSVNGGNLLRRALGRLQGYTQPISTIGAQHNVTYGW